MENQDKKRQTKTVAIRLSDQDYQWLMDECIGQLKDGSGRITPTIFIRKCIMASHERRVAGVPLSVPLLLVEIRDILKDVEKELDIRQAAYSRRASKTTDIPV